MPKSKENSEQISSTKKSIPSLKVLEKRIYKKFHKKNCFTNLYYGKLIINNIIYNEKTHIVAKFKDYLVIDDFSEFLKRFYKRKESITRLPLYFDYYFIYSKIFPNYTGLAESKYIYKNIHRKQKMIDLQQEEESEERKIEKEKKEIKHQRRKNKNEVNTIFNNDIYNSIMKQSQDLYMLLFGIEKNNNDNTISTLDIKDIVKCIEKYDYESKIRFNYKNNIIIPKLYKNIEQKKINKKENNSSSTTKQSTFNSSSIQQKMKNFAKLYKNKEEIIIGLKKIKNEKNTLNSNSLLISHKISKKYLLNKHFKTLTSNNLFISKENSKSKSTKKEFRKVNKIKVNQKLINDDKFNYLTERSSINNRYKNLKFDFSNNINRNKNNNILPNNNSRTNSKFLNKKSIDFNYYSYLNSINNSNIYKHKRINTNTNINETSTNKSFKIKLLNRAKAKNISEYNNKIKFNLKEMRESIKNNNISDKKCFTERESIILSSNSNKNKIKDRITFPQNLLKDNIHLVKRISNHKKSFPSIEIKSKINKKILLSQRIISSSKINKFSLKTNFLPLPFKENYKINKNQIMQICNRKLSSNLNNNKDKNYYTERHQQYPEREIKQKLNIKNDFLILKNIETKYHKTSANSKNKDKLQKIDKEKISNNKNNIQGNKKSKGKKQIKRKEISPIEFSKYVMLNNTERNRNNCYIKMLLNQNKK